jgi:hypothetical protein
MPILTVRKAMVERLETALRGIDVKAHPRPGFGPADLTAALKDKPLAIRLAFVSVPEDAVWSSNETDMPCAWAIYLAAKDIGGTAPSRETQVLTILPRIIELVASFGWAQCCGEHRAENIRSAELYAGEVDGQSACVWSVTWRQVLTVSPCDNGDDLRPFLTLITRYDIEPADGTIDASDTISMPRTT